MSEVKQLPDRTFDYLAQRLQMHIKLMTEAAHTEISRGEVQTILNGYRELQIARAQLYECHLEAVRALAAHRHPNPDPSQRVHCQCATCICAFDEGEGE